MALRTGIDSVGVPAVQAAVDAHGERYLSRVYTARERADCTRPDGTLDVASLAARWAAKEALVKALRAGEGGFGWTDVEVVRAPGGHPQLRLHGPLRSLAQSLDCQDIAVSLTHEAGLATAVVVTMVQHEISADHDNRRQ